MTETIQSSAENLLHLIFTHILPSEGFALRESQRRLSLSMLRALEGGQIGLSEAEVGTGKTHAYLLAAIVHRICSGSTSPTLLSTSTVALQTAITEQYLPQISEILLRYGILEKPLTWRLRKGKSHYVCDQRLQSYIASLKTWEEVGFHNLALLALLDDPDNPDIDLDGSELPPRIRARINVKSSCGGCRLCSLKERCRYQWMSREQLAGGYDFLITNHNYIFADVLTGGSLLPAHDAVIFDEAHKLPEAARDMYGEQIREQEIPNLIRYTVPEKCGSPALLAHTGLLTQENQALFRRLTEPLSAKEQQRYPVSLTTANRIRLGNLLQHIRQLPELCRGIFTEQKLREIRRICGDIGDKLQHIRSAPDRICWLERQEEGWRICSVPKELQTLLRRDFWQSSGPCILTSGTLCGTDGFGHIRRVLGLEALPKSRVTELRTPSPFDYRNHRILYLPEMPAPKRQEAYLSALSEEICRLVALSRGRALVLFTSYRLMKRVFALTEDRLSAYPLFCMDRGRLEVIDQFRRSGNGVLFASDTCGEGMDIAGDALSLVIIVRLPFPVPDPVSDYEKSLYPTLRAYVQASAVPQMTIKLKQYAGRLIRTETDTGVIAILDNRAGFSGRYHRPVLDALSDTDATDQIEQIRAFLYRCKTPSYFMDEEESA